MFALVDCNNFYASCERVFRPDLVGVPIVILSNNDGCVIARSNEAKAVGIPMGAPAYQYEKTFQEKGVQVFSANFVLYGDMSNRVMSILSDYSPDIEIYSIDEAFLKLQGFDYFKLLEYGENMRSKIAQWTGIPVSVGIAPTKTLAKLANRIAKKFPKKTNGTYCIDNEEKRIKALKWLKIGDVWGIGRQHAKRLQTMGVQTAYDFVCLDDKVVKRTMSIVGLRTKKELEGQSVLDLEQAQAKQSISTTRSFETNYTELEQLSERIATFASFCAEKLRKQKMCCRSVVVFIQTNKNRKDLPQYNRKLVINLPFATNSTLELVKFTQQGLKQLFKKGYAYKKAGVIVHDFVNENQVQMSLFVNRNPRHISLMKAIDRLNTNHGQQKVRLASQDLQRVWKMKQLKLSPRYTTHLKEVIAIRV